MAIGQRLDQPARLASGRTLERQPVPRCGDRRGSHDQKAGPRHGTELDRSERIDRTSRRPSAIDFATPLAATRTSRMESGQRIVPASLPCQRAWDRACG
jgi:hypothetical protein